MKGDLWGRVFFYKLKHACCTIDGLASPFLGKFSLILLADIQFHAFRCACFNDKSGESPLHFLYRSSLFVSNHILQRCFAFYLAKMLASIPILIQGISVASSLS